MCLLLFLTRPSFDAKEAKRNCPLCHYCSSHESLRPHFIPQNQTATNQSALSVCLSCIASRPIDPLSFLPLLSTLASTPRLSLSSVTTPNSKGWCSLGGLAWLYTVHNKHSTKSTQAFPPFVLAPSTVKPNLDTHTLSLHNCQLPTALFLLSTTSL